MLWFFSGFAGFIAFFTLLIIQMLIKRLKGFKIKESRAAWFEFLFVGAGFLLICRYKEAFKSIFIVFVFFSLLHWIIDDASTRGVCILVFLVFRYFKVLNYGKGPNPPRRSSGSSGESYYDGDDFDSRGGYDEREFMEEMHHRDNF